MSPEQIIAIISTIVGAPFLLKFVERWAEGKKFKLQADENHESVRDEREWRALEIALERERNVYKEILEYERTQFTRRLVEFEARLAKIQEDSKIYQEKYWQERLSRELLQTRVDALETELAELRKGKVE